MNVKEYSNKELLDLLSIIKKTGFSQMEKEVFDEVSLRLIHLDRLKVRLAGFKEYLQLELQGSLRENQFEIEEIYAHFNKIFGEETEILDLEEWLESYTDLSEKLISKVKEIPGIVKFKKEDN